MALSVNKVTLLGNVGKDPDYKITPNGTPVCKFSLATSESYKDKETDEWKNISEWHNIECWRYTAETANKHLTKGSKVYIEGKLKTDKYEKDGVTVYSTKIVAQEIVLINPKSENSVPTQYDDRPLPPDKGNSYQTKIPTATYNENMESEAYEDVPF